MAYHLPHLPGLRAFEAAARHESFTAAAHELHLTAAAVSQQVRALEQHLGHALFERLARGVRLTDMGRAYLPAVRRAFDELSLTTAGLFGGYGQRLLTLRAPISFAVLVLAPHIAAFRSAHPEVQLRVLTAVWADGAEPEDVDLDIRFGDGRWSGYEVEVLVREDSVPVCSPQHAAAGAVSLPALAQRALVHISGCEELWPKLLRHAGLPERVGRAGITADTSLMALELAAAGHGCALVLESFAAPYLASGRLLRPVDAVLPQEQAHYLLIPRGPAAARPEQLLLRDWLLQAFG